jgi:hypothetical protein
VDENVAKGAVDESFRDGITVHLKQIRYINHIRLRPADGDHEKIHSYGIEVSIYQDKGWKTVGQFRDKGMQRFKDWNEHKFGVVAVKSIRIRGRCEKLRRSGYSHLDAGWMEHVPFGAIDLEAYLRLG